MTPLKLSKVDKLYKIIVNNEILNSSIEVLFCKRMRALGTVAELCHVWRNQAALFPRHLKEFKSFKKHIQARNRLCGCRLSEWMILASYLRYFSNQESALFQKSLMTHS